MTIKEIPTGNLPYEVVNELPKKGEENKVYGVPVGGDIPHCKNYRWHNDAWEEVDLGATVFGFQFADYQESVQEVVAEMQAVIGEQAQKIAELEEEVFHEMKSTVLYEDGILIINELASAREKNINEHGSIVAEYPPLDNKNQYKFKSASDQYWAEQRTLINKVAFGSLTEPTSMGFWFQHCKNLQEVDWFNFKGDANTTCRATFSYTQIMQLDLPYMPNLESIQYICRSCDYLTSAIFHKVFAKNIKNTTDAFQGCYNLTEAHFVGLAGSVEECERMFANISNDGRGDMQLHKIYVDNNLHFEEATSSANMFRSCANLVGGCGTEFNSQMTNNTYARIDTHDSPGYFTEA